MNLLADENIKQAIVDRLRLDGHAVWYVVEMEPGVSDDVVLDLANREGALLLTGDKDFGELVFRLGRVAFGVILVRKENYRFKRSLLFVPWERSLFSQNC